MKLHFIKKLIRKLYINPILHEWDFFIEHNRINKMNRLLILLIVCLIEQSVTAQTKMYDHNTIVWMQNVNTLKINESTSAHLEYNLRRINGVDNHMQRLLRLGVNYKVGKEITAHIGYANAQTYAYGDYPVITGRKFPEHRLYQQINIQQQLQKLNIQHRLRVEQRWVGVLKPNTQSEVARWNFLHRFRYMIKTQVPISKMVTAAVTDEIFIGAGKNLGINIFDQNRIWLSLAKKLSKQLTLEIGYFNLVLQQGRLVDNKIVVQKNNGLLLALISKF